MNSETPATPRPPAALILSTPVHLFAFGFGLGLSPFAPGTLGTLLGIPLFLLLVCLPWQVFVVATLSLTLVGIWLCGASSRMLGVKDHGGIVFDEVVGYLISCAVLLPIMQGPSWHLATGMTAAFVLFRFFDILKPWPINWCDRHVHGGFGIMLDDILAGVAAAASLWGLGQIPFTI